MNRWLKHWPAFHEWGGRTRPQPREWDRPGREALTAADPAVLLPAPDEVEDPVLRVILERAQAGSRPRARADKHLVCLAVEGGGMRGAVSAGMCVVLEAVGLVGAIDLIFGVSAGALNGCATAMGRAAFGATLYQDAASHGVIDPVRPLRGGPVIDFDLLFEELIAARKPWSLDRLASGPEFRALATSLETQSLRVLAGFTDIDELMQAVRASASLPRLGGEPPVFRGERMTDGGLREPIPFETAIADGATHVLVLRSRPGGYRMPQLSGLCDSFALRADAELIELVRGHHRVYNRQAAELEHRPAASCSGAHVFQVSVPDGTRVIRRLEPSSQRLVDALRLGAKAMASAIMTEPIDLCWQPVVYRATPLTAEPASPNVCSEGRPRRGPQARTIDPVRDGQPA